MFPFCQDNVPFLTGIIICEPLDSICTATLQFINRLTILNQYGFFKTFFGFWLAVGKQTGRGKKAISPKEDFSGRNVPFLTGLNVIL